MLSRRQILVTSAAVFSGSGFAGCLSEAATTTTADYLQLKDIQVEWTHENSTSRGTLLQTRSTEQGELSVSVAEEYAQLGSFPSEIVVSEEAHNQLNQRFESVEYIIGLCGTDFGDSDRNECQNTSVSREDFNRVQYGGTAEVTFSETELQIHEAEDADVDEWDISVEEFELAERYSEYNGN